MIKKYLILFIPPIIFKFRIWILKKIRKESIKSGWFGKYKSWDDAYKDSTGYDNLAIIEKVVSATKKVLNNEALFERDSVLFYEMEYNWPVLSLLTKISFENKGNLRVLDYGGSMGSSFFQYSKFLGNKINYDWRVVEQKHFVKEANQIIKPDSLTFYKSIDEACKNWQPDVVLLSSVLPYLEFYREVLEQIISFNPRHIVVDRNTFINGKERITLQVVPESIYEASYPCRFFNKKDLIDLLNEKYNFILEFKSYCDPDNYIFDDGEKAYWGGLYFKSL